MSEGVENAENAPRCFNDEFPFGIDAKRRLQIPAKWKPGLSRFTLLLWPLLTGNPDCLLGLPPDRMKYLTQKLREVPLRKGDAWRRQIGKSSADVDLDSASRICLPKRLADAAGLKKRALLVGMVDRFQIWDPERYKSVSSLDEAENHTDYYDDGSQLEQLIQGL